MMKNIKIYDIECYHNYFCVGIKDYETKQSGIWEISEERNDIEKIYNYFSKFSGFLVSVNGIHYDNIVVKCLLKNYKYYKNLSYLEVCKELKKVSDNIINDNYEDIKQYKWFKIGWTDIDLFCYWSKMLRISKKISLKSLAVQLNYPVIQELPYAPHVYLKKEDLPKLRHYNLVHDLGITELLFIQFLGKGNIPLGNLGTVQMRQKVNEKYGINAFSFDAPKIASEVMMYKYCEKTNQDLNEFKKLRFQKDSFQFKQLFTEYNFEFKTDLFKNVFADWMESYDYFNKTFTCFTQDKKHGMMLSIGIGGIHNLLKNEIYEISEEYELVDIDIESLYPTFILGLHCFRFKELEETYNEFKTLRVTESKPNIKKFKGTDKEQFWKEEDAFNKVVLNGISGHIDQEYSPLYNNIGAMKMRCMGQLVLLIIIEKIHLENIQIIQVNTDGLTVKLHKSKKEWFTNVVTETEKLYNVKFEYGYYKKMILANVNNYLAIDLDDRVKQKGMFVEKPELGNSVDELIIAKSLNAFFVKNISPKEFISNPDKYNLHIYDYCKSNKIEKKFKVLHNGQIQQQLNRYYFSKNAPYLYKQQGVGTLQHVNVGEGVELFNNFIEKDWKDYKINYNYYIKQTQKIIDSLNNQNQMSLF